MKEQITDILIEPKIKLTNDKLEAYIKGNLNSDERHDVEKWFSEKGFESDAMEGLLEIDDIRSSMYIQESVNRVLLKKIISLKDLRKEKNKHPKINTWVILVVLLVLLLQVIVFVFLAVGK